jgi:hypothetical protein
MKKLLLLSAMLLVFGVMTASAQVFDFTVVNKTGYTIDAIYVSPADDNDWGEDVLGEDQLPNGKSFEIKFDATYEKLLLAFGVDKYDLRAEFSDGAEDEYYDLKLEDINTLTLTVDKKGNGVATWK